MNPLLARQLRKHLPDLDPAAPPWRDFLAAIDAAYVEFEQDHAFLEHTLEVTSDELTEANEKLRREADRQLASLSRYYQQTLELQQGMILCIRRTARGFVHTLCRGQLLTRLGLSPADFEGHTIEEIAPPAHAAELNAAFVRAWSGESCAISFTSSNGLELFMQLRPLSENSHVREIIASCVEITALKEAERELRTAKERAEAADRAKSEFLAVMSHEIRTPLNAVLGFSTLLEQSPLNAEQLSWLKAIGTSGESLLALISDILDFSKIEAGHLDLNAEPVALADVLDHVTSMFRPRAEEKGIVFEVTAVSELPQLVLTDPHRLTQILANLVGNALKFTQRGSVRVLVYPGIDDASDAARGDRKIHFAVHDTGIGIPAHRRDRLFKPFSQVDSSTTRHYGGTGLGLAICDRLVRLLGGAISAESIFGEGSTFSFWIRAPATTLLDLSCVHSESPAPLSPSTSVSQSRIRILVAEDQTENRDLIARVLQTRGYQPDVVENGRLAVEAATRTTYDVILLDLSMPEMDGYAAARAIRAAFGDRPRPKIYALTASAFPEDRERCTRSGMDGVLTKPLNFQELFATMAVGNL